MFRTGRYDSHLCPERGRELAEGLLATGGTPPQQADPATGGPTLQRTHRDIEPADDSRLHRHLRQQGYAKPVGYHLNQRQQAGALESGIALIVFQRAGRQGVFAQAVTVFQQQQFVDHDFRRRDRGRR